MTYIVIFNVGYKDSEILTDSSGFVEEFIDYVTAVEIASEWIDGTQYRKFNVYEEII